MDNLLEIRDLEVRFDLKEGTVHAVNGVSLDLAPIVVHEVTVVGSRCGPMDEAVAMLARGEVEVEPLVSGVFALAESPQALWAADRPEAVKVLVRC